MKDYTGERINLSLVTVNFTNCRPEGIKRENCHWYSGVDCYVEKVKIIKNRICSPTYIYSQFMSRHKNFYVNKKLNISSSHHQIPSLTKQCVGKTFMENSLSSCSTRPLQSFLHLQNCLCKWGAQKCIIPPGRVVRSCLVNNVSFFTRQRHCIFSCKKKKKSLFNVLSSQPLPEGQIAKFTILAFFPEILHSICWVKPTNNVKYVQNGFQRCSIN